MEAVCAKVSTVSEFLDDAAKRVSNLEAGMDRQECEWRQRDEIMQNALDGITAELSHKAEA